MADDEKKEVDPKAELKALINRDAFGLRTYRCNAPPAEPFDPKSELESHAALAEVFASGTWRIDGCRERKSLNHEKIVEHVVQYGKNSLYATCECPHSGVNALHACAINGYLSLMKVLVEKAEMSPLKVAKGLACMLSSRLEHARGADVLWMAKRRGHKHIVDWLKTLPIVRQATTSVEKQLVVMGEAHRAAVGQARELKAAERKREAEEEALRLAAEKKRKEKEKAQRKMRDEINVFDGRMRAKRKALNDPEYVFKQAATGRTESLELLEDEKQTHRQEKNRSKHMRSLAEDNEIGNEMRKPEGLIVDIDEILTQFTTLWQLDGEVDEFIADARTTAWGDLAPEELEESGKKLYAKVKKLPKMTKQSDAFKALDAKAKKFVSSTPLILSLHTPAMKTRHWAELLRDVSKVEGADPSIADMKTPLDDPDIELSVILGMRMHEAKVAIVVEEVTDKAVKEAKQEETLKGLEASWSKIEWLMHPYDKDPDVPLLKMDEKDFEQLEADLLTLQSMVSSRYDFFKKESVQWQQELQNVGEVVAILAELQRMWSYLEPLFIGSDEVKKELPETAAKFAGIDAVVRSVLAKTWRMKNVKASCNQAKLIATLEDLTVQQDMCKKSLNEFLDNKRMQFARFYFVSEADLLDILSNGSNPKLIMKHVDKVMLSTKGLSLRDDGDRPMATEYIAGVGKERCDFDPPVRLEGKVEVYLQTVLRAQTQSLEIQARASLKRYAKQPRLKWLQDEAKSKADGKQNATDAAQVGLLIAAIYYTSECEAAMREVEKMGGADQPMETFLAKTISQLNELITLTKSDLNGSMRTRVMTMITYDAHSRDMVEAQLRQRALQLSSFQWQSQLKMRFDEKEGRWLVHILNAEFDYGFEYLGNGPRLVVTPLTDRVYVTATQALNLCMGCAPAGPAGTGKTESTKDLAAALGKCCYVFNCSPEMDYKSLGNIFKGLACSGSWGCFDEFNRLIPEVLSVCTVQFKAVCNAVRNVKNALASAKKSGTKASSMDPRARLAIIEGDEIHLDETCGAFITMNPGYLGRSELPEGLKALFRPMTVMVPDLVLICENMLMAQGFVTSKSLASKFYSLYSLLKDLLSNQEHYDWGLRAIKSVLVVAGMLLRDDPNSDEDSILMRALRDFNIAKIVKVDEVVFFGLLNDLFPGLDPPRVVDKSLEDSVSAAIDASGQFGDDVMRLKCVQLDELLAIRHCVFVMGPPGAFKTTCWRLLAAARAIKNPDAPVKIVDVNPKTMPTQDLYGYINMVTRDWKDGLLSTVMRDLGQIPDEKPKWILLDGDLDANWIESMNSVMDDNRMLTLASNERIPLKPHMRMIFEIRDLKHATPATVSRAGILYISTDEGFQWKSLINTWVSAKTTAEGADYYTDEGKMWLTQCFDEYVATSLRFFRKMLTSIPQQETTLVTNLLRLLDSLIGANELASQKNIEMTFAFACAWALGSALGVGDDGKDYRKVFSEWWKKTFRKVAFPPKDTIFDYYLDPATMTFESWEKSPAFAHVNFDSRDQSMSDLTVPTGESASVTFWMERLITAHHHVMLAGASGTGKTMLVKGQLDALDKDLFLYQTINMNFYTSGLVLQANLEVSLQKKTGSLYGPPGNKHLVYFVDDINLPELDKYNTQSGIALIRQHIDYSHWYDISKLTLKTVEKCHYVTGMNPTAGSFQVNPRLQRHFMTFAIGMPSDASLTQIYDTFMKGHFDSVYTDPKFADLKDMTEKLIKATLVVHKEVASTFRKTATNFHYEFNIRHVGNIFQGLLMCGPAKINTPEAIATCWLHECFRVYGDRLVSPEDLGKYETLMGAAAKKNFGEYNLAPYFLPSSSAEAKPLIFAHFMQGVGEDPVYEQVISMDDCSKILVQALEEYNESNAQMDLVLFEDALCHICRITRIINNARGHALLVGVGGSGKKSLTRLAGFICSYTTVMIQVSATYGISDLKDDLKIMYNKAGVKGEGVLFLFTDAEITNEKFLVYLNDLLGSADIADLYMQDEKDTVINAVMKKAKAAGVTPEAGPVYEFFLAEVRKYLHVVLCFSPVGEDFRIRCRKFPALVNCTVIDWFQPWPYQALYSVGCKFLTQIEDLGGDDVRTTIQDFMPFSFSSTNELAVQFKAVEGRYVYTTPKSYLELLKLYSLLLGQKRTENDVASARLKNGIKKLEDCTSVVDELKEAIAVDVQDAEQKKEVAEGIAKRVKSEKEVVEMESENAAIEEKKVTKIAAEVTAKQASAEEDLEKAIPAVEKAMAALDTLDVKALQMCKTMAKPPPGVDDIFSACMVLLAGVLPAVPAQKNGKVKDKDRTWDNAKKVLLGDPKRFVDDLKGFRDVFDAGNVPNVNWKEVRPYIAMEHFKPEIIEGKNSAAAGLCNWAVNIVVYYDVVSMVEPKKKLVAEAKEQLREANEKLDAVRKKVAELEERLRGLIAELTEAEKTKASAEATVAKGQRKLSLASRLLNALSSESVRWNASVEDLAQTKRLLIGDTLLSASFISYIGPFTKAFRNQLLEDQWLPRLRAPPLKSGAPVPMSRDCDPLTALTTESEVASWQNFKLPSDPVSTENGAIVSRSTRWPLLIDPQLQGVAWVKAQFGKDLRVARLGTKDLLMTLKGCLAGGCPMLVENMGEEIEASIMPAVQRLKMRRGTRFFLKLGEDEVEYHSDFRMMLHTKLSNPHYQPEIQAECTLVNFTVTPSGLEDQLLALVVSKERPDLASQKVSLIQQQNQFKIKMIQIEDEILARLAAAEGDITDDKELIEGLEAAKKTAVEIEAKLVAGRKTTESINNTSEKFRAAARRGSQLFFVMNELVKIHTYYIYSLNAFVVVFLNGIDVVQREAKQAFEAGQKRKGALTQGASSFKKIAKSVIAGIERFPWNRNILMEASHASAPLTDDFLGRLMHLDAGAASSRPRGQDGFAIGELVECDLAVGKIIKMLAIGVEKKRDALVIEVLEDVGDPKLHIEPAEGAPEKQKKKKKKKKHLCVPCDMCEKYIDYAARNKKLIETCTSVCFNYVRRGLFERDKLTIVALFVMTLQIADEKLPAQYLDVLLASRDAHDGEAPPAAVAAWMPESVWPKLRALQEDLGETVPRFASLLRACADKPAEWETWYNSLNPEAADPPAPDAGEPEDAAVPLTLVERVLLLSATRSDRVTMAVAAYIRAEYGDHYISQPPFDMKKTFMETTASTPIFFVLFPGVDPTTWVEQLGENFGITIANNKFVNISMGQGQEAPAEAMIERMAKEGGWVMLNNLHLMQNWLPVLERKLEVASENAHADFRCYCSAEPPGFSYQRNMPESLMQSCIKVSNEAPSDIKSNIERAWAPFTQDLLDSCSLPTEFRACLFGLCFFHGVMLGRKRFGQQGWSRKYGFNMGDLTICADVLQTYLDDKGLVPWEDLRYIFGEIMYGGHITDFWDRRTNNTYLAVSFTPGLLTGQDLGHAFAAPDAASMPKREDYVDYLKTALPPESPLIYGLHMNSEIAYLNSSTTLLVDTILRLKAGSKTGGGAVGGGGGGGGGDTEELIDDLVGRLPEQFDLFDVNDKALPLLKGQDAPYIVVLLQELGRMNGLTAEVARSLEELKKGLLGQLNMSQTMEDLLSALIIRQVPGRNPFHAASWEKHAWPSMKGLNSWYLDVIARCDQLTRWSSNDGLKSPFSMWISGLFNPTAFLTAIKQVTARNKQLPLDKMTTETHVSAMTDPNELTAGVTEGAYVNGFFSEGACWGAVEDGAHEYTVDGIRCSGILQDSRPKELLPPLPLMYIKAVQVQPSWDPSSVGYLRPEADIYNCPVYLTTFRGPTFVFVATLKTKDPASTWILRGVALIAQVDL